jgi:hypothetical protein
MRARSIAFLALPLLACGTSARRGTTGGDDDAGLPRGDLAISFTDVDMAAARPTDDAGATDDAGETDDAGQPDPCLERAKLIYVIDESNMLSSYYPKTNKFADVGMVNCPAQFGSQPNSMAIDHNAVAWVNYSSGEIFYVNTLNAQCMASKWVAGTGGYDTVGMGFAADKVGMFGEHLYVASIGGGKLGSIDPMTLMVNDIGMLDGQPELTGTADTKL